MSGSINVSGLVTGLNSSQLISQIMSLERQPLSRLQQQVSTLTQQKTVVRDLRSTLLTLRNKAQDFRLTNLFNQFQSKSSDEDVMTTSVTGESPVSGSYVVNVTKLASATSASSSSKLGGAINTTVALNSSGISSDIAAGTFTINGVQFTVNPATDSLNTVMSAINSSSAGVTATYNASSDTITLKNTAANNTSIINFGDENDTSDFLSIIAVTQATQATNGNGSTELTSTHNLGAVNAGDALNTVNFASGAVTSGTFKINGVTITIDTANDSLSDVLGQINDSAAGVTASYDTSTDTIKVVSNTLGSRTISFQAGTSNFLTATNLASATQVAGSDSQFTINGGVVQTRNSNEISDAIGGVTLRLLSTGESTVTVSVNNDAIVEDVNDFLKAFNDAVKAINDQTAKGGGLEGDSSFQEIVNTIRTTIFNQVSGINGSKKSLVDIGISTGDSFDSSTISDVQLNSEDFLDALRSGRANIHDIFSNSAGTGIADQIFDYLDSATSTTGYLNERVKSNGTIDQQINDINDRIDSMQKRLAQKEARLKAQFTKLETMASTYQSQGASLSGIQNAFGSL